MFCMPLVGLEVLFDQSENVQINDLKLSTIADKVNSKFYYLAI